MIFLETDRLILRSWQPKDFEPFAKLTSDPRVMEFFPSLLTQEESAENIKLMTERIETNGFCFWAAETRATQEFIGFIGLNVPGIQAPFTPCVEIGWRLAYEYWGQGFAPEGAIGCLKYGFEKLKLKEIVAFTPKDNLRSRRVMEKIGMTYDLKGDFDHPKITEGHPLRRHVLYRVNP
jgi:RimJ/RimL family protein N-acetyltransferase